MSISPAQANLIFELTKPLRSFFKLRQHDNTSSTTSRHCSRNRALRQTYAGGISRHVFRPRRSRRGCEWLLCALHNRNVRHAAFIVHSSSQVQREFPELKQILFLAGAFWVRRDFVFLFCFLRAHTACRTYEADLPHLPLY